MVNSCKKIFIWTSTPYYMHKKALDLLCNFHKTFSSTFILYFKTPNFAISY